MTHHQALALAAAGLALLSAGVTWLFGPYGLIGSGVAILAMALLIPRREGHGEPAVEFVLPPDGDPDHSL